MKASLRSAVIVLAVIVSAAITPTIHADSVLLGSDYLHTLPGTFFDFGGPIGPVALQGLPISPGTLGDTDTIVQRKADAILPGPATIPIELVQLSLQSVAPINIGGTFFDVYVHLTPSIPSPGTMTIRHEGPDVAGPTPEGTFDSFFDVFFTADFTEVGNPINTFPIPGEALLNSSGALWSHDPLPGTLQVTGPAGDQNANDHTARPPTFSDMNIITQVDEEKDPPGSGRHLVEAAHGPTGPTDNGVPEPSIIVMLGAGLAALAYSRRISSSKR